MDLISSQAEHCIMFKSHLTEKYTQLCFYTFCSIFWSFFSFSFFFCLLFLKPACFCYFTLFYLSYILTVFFLLPFLHFTYQFLLLLIKLITLSIIDHDTFLFRQRTGEASEWLRSSQSDDRIMSKSRPSVKCRVQSGAGALPPAGFRLDAE